uniref:Ankyrin repeat-containing protein n=1 Tax=Rhizophora mucronata TaxID=61149 RepID=A0A2P2MYP8_RHIMU
MPPSYFPLRWESIGDQWWYASPIDFAAANGHYDLVRELLHLDTNLLIKLTSLRRIRRLETVWDDEEQFNDVAKCRALVARKLLLECETKRGHNTLIRAGYGGWLLYTAASAGDVGFVRRLLERDPLLVFGEGEYGVTDILYAAARSKNSEVFWLLLNFSISRYGLSSGGEFEGQLSESQLDFRWDMMNRAIHAAARGGTLEILKELLNDCSDVLVYRDAQGSTILHAAAGRGQVNVVNYLIESFDIVGSMDYLGNTALHVAAYWGYLAVAEILIHASPSLTSVVDNYGGTFLHLAVTGFRTSGFRRIDKQIELMKQLVNGTIVNIQDIINIKNNDGRTALHVAIIENIQSNLVELLMTVSSINLNIRDVDGMTPLDLLKQRPRSASSEILIKQLISAGGISNCQDNAARSAIFSHLKGQDIGCSPGTSFRIPDAEIFLYTGIENVYDASGNLETIDSSTCLSEQSDYLTPLGDRKSGSLHYATRRLKSLLQWRWRKDKKPSKKLGDDDSLDSFNQCRSMGRFPLPLRQIYSKNWSSSRIRRTFSVSSSFPSPLTRRKFAAGLMHGVIRAVPHLSVPGQSPTIPFSGSSVSSSSSLDKEKVAETKVGLSSNRSLKLKQASFNKKLMNQYFCFGAQGLVTEDSLTYTGPDHSYKRVTSLVA